jgi:hypothetical protein
VVGLPVIRPNERNANYRILTNVVNPALESLGLWADAERALSRVLGVHRRRDVQRAALVLAREPEFFGAYLPVVRRRVAAELAGWLCTTRPCLWADRDHPRRRLSAPVLATIIVHQLVIQASHVAQLVQ